MTERLAVDGGPPVRDRMLPYARHTVDDDDVRAVEEALRSDWLTTGPAVEAFERAVADYVGARHAVAVSSGTAALHAAAFAAGVSRGDEVVTTPLSFAATANCALYCGARPVFADVQPDTCLIDPEQVAARMTAATRAVIPVDYAGQPADMDALRELTRERGTVLISDAAHSLSARYRGAPVGRLADFTVFSMHPVKPITAGEGGLVVTDDDDAARRLRAFRSHGIEADAHERARRGDWHYEMGFLGYNYRIPDLLCALGRSQLAKLERWRKRRAALAHGYTKAFAELPEIRPLAQRPDRDSAWHLYVVRLGLERLRVGRAEVFRALRAEGIGVNVHYIPIYHHPYYRSLGYAPGECPVAEAQYERLLTLPLWPGMTDDDARDVVQAVHKVVAAYRIA